MECYTNCNIITEEGIELDFKNSIKPFSKLLKILNKRKKKTNVLGIDIETYASYDLVATRKIYQKLRKKDYKEEGKKISAATIKKFDNEYNEVLKEVALNTRLNTVRLVQVNTGYEVLIFDLKGVDKKQIEKLYRCIMDFSLIVQNAKFDIGSIKSRNLWFEPKELFDTMIANKIYRASQVTGRFSSNLYEVIAYWLGIELDKGHGASNWGGLITTSMFSYSYYDVRYLIRCAKAQIAKLNGLSINTDVSYFDKRLTDKVSIIEMKFLKPLIETEIKGIPVDIEFMEGKKKEFSKQYKNALKPLTKYNINLGSPLQLLDLLVSKGIACESTGKPVLLRHREHKIVRRILKLKESSKQLQMVTDYIGKWLENDNRMYPSFN